MPKFLPVSQNVPPNRGVGTITVTTAMAVPLFRAKVSHVSSVASSRPAGVSDAYVRARMKDGHTRIVR